MAEVMAATPVATAIGTLPIWRGVEAAGRPALVVHQMPFHRANVCSRRLASGLYVENRAECISVGGARKRQQRMRHGTRMPDTSDET
jgi:hypothetical protein